MNARQFAACALLVAPLVLTACDGSADARSVPQAVETAISEAAQPPEPTGTIIEVKMITDDKGNYFEPNVIEARPGDVLRFKLTSGVHNVSFPADKNAGGLELPQPSDFLQLPGQTHDLTVGLPPGEYAFQCDPHAALGMTGTLRVVQ